MTWAKFDDGYLDNPKCRAAGKDGRALDVAGIIHCAQALNDGVIASYDAPLVAAKAEVNFKRTATRLVAVGRWHEAGHGCERCPPCAPGEFVVHDYLDYNPSAQKAQAKKKARAEAGRKGGQRSRPKPPTPPGGGQAKAEAIASTFGSQELEQRPSKNGTPYPGTPTEEPSSSYGLTTDADLADDDSNQHQSSSVVGAALGVLAQRDLDARRLAKPDVPIGDPTAWFEAAYDRRRSSDQARLEVLHAEHPDAGQETLADLLEPAPAPPIALDVERGRRRSGADPEHQVASRRHIVESHERFKESMSDADEPADPAAVASATAAAWASLPATSLARAGRQR